MKSFLGLLIFLNTFCGGQTKDNPRIIDAFILAYDSMYTYDNKNQKDYIILDMESSYFAETTYEDREKMINYFKNYNKDILKASIFKLKEIGLADELTQIKINGDILMFTCVRPNNSGNGIIINGMKYHSPVAAEIYEIKLEVIDNQWKLVDIKQIGVA